MRILLCHKLYETTGGAEVFFHETARVLRSQGHNVMCVATGDGESSVETTILQAPAYDGVGLGRKLMNLPSAIYSMKSKKAISNLISEFQPDVLHAFAIHVHLSPSVLVAAKEAHIPVVMTCNDYKHICPNYKLYHHGKVCFECAGGKFYKAVTNTCCKGSVGLSLASAAEAYAHRLLRVYERYVDVFTFSSAFMEEKTQEFWRGRTIIATRLRNPFRSDLYQASDTYEDYGLYFGRLIDEKGVHQLVEAASMIDGFPIKIVGSGPQEPFLRDQVERKRLSNVEFLGAMWGQELDRILSKARFVIVPSMWHENFPYVINQAFALARPVIGSRRGGITELVEDGVRGLIYDADDVRGLASAIAALARSKERCVAMGRSAKEYSDENFNDERFYRDLMKTYDRAFHARDSFRR